MDRQTLEDQLNTLLAGEVRSMIRLVDQATPYVTPQTYAQWQRIQSGLGLSREHEQRLAQLIQSRGLQVKPSVYASDVAGYHYVDLPTLTQQLANEKQRQVQAYQAAIQHAGGDDHVLGVLNELLAQIESQLHVLAER